MREQPTIPTPLSEHPAEPKPDTAAAAATAAQAAATPDWFARAVRIARWLLVPYAGLVLIGGFLTVVMASYGLAHGSSESNAAFLLLVVLGMLVLVLPPFALLLNGRAWWLRGLQTVGMGVLCVGVFLGLGVVYQSILSPRLLAARLDAVVAPITIDSVAEEPYLNPATGSLPIGLRVRANVRLPKAVALDQFGVVVLEALEQGMVLVAKDAKGILHSAPTERAGWPTVTVNGQPIDALPGMAAHRALPYGRRADGAATLPAGVYQVTQDYWWAGLRNPEGVDWKDPHPTPCIVEDSTATPQIKKAIADRIAEASNLPLSVSIGARMSLGGRRGYRHFYRVAPLTSRYDHGAWQATLAGLPFASCDVIAAQRKAQQDAIDLVKKAEVDKRNYFSGAIPHRENPLYAEACAGDLNRIQARIDAEKSADGVWLPRFSLEYILSECTIDKPNVAVFKLLAPTLHAQAERGLGESKAAYCAVLEPLHAYRRFLHLAALSELGLPLDCDGKQLWRSGLLPEVEGAPRRYGYTRVDTILENATRSDNVAWVKFLVLNKVDLCQIGGPYNHVNTGTSYLPTLLRLITPYYGADMILAVREAGCDPHLATPASDMSTAMDDPAERYSAAVLWTLRRHGASGRPLGPLTSANAATLAKLDRLMQPTAKELSETKPTQIGSILGSMREIVATSPPSLLRALLASGAPPNAGFPPGKSWFIPFYDTWRLRDEEVIALMAVLTDEQLKQVINASGPHIEDAAKTMFTLRRTDDPAGGGKPAIRAYVCKRRVLKCD